MCISVTALHYYYITITKNTAGFFPSKYLSLNVISVFRDLVHCGTPLVYKLQSDPQITKNVTVSVNASQSLVMEAQISKHNRWTNGCNVVNWDGDNSTNLCC